MILGRCIFFHLRSDSLLLLSRRRLDALLRDERLQNASVRVLRVPEVEQLVEELVDEDEVVLHVLLADLSKVGGHDVAHLEQELEDHGGVDILLGDGGEPDVGALDVEEGGARDVGDGGADLLPRVDHVDAEGVDSVAADVVAVDARDEHLALVVVDEETADHGDGHEFSVLPPKFQGSFRDYVSVVRLCLAEPVRRSGSICGPVRLLCSAESARGSKEKEALFSGKKKDLHTKLLNL